MPAFHLKADSDNLFKERLTQEECCEIAHRAIALGLLHPAAPEPPHSRRLRPPANKRQPHEFHVIPIDWATTGVPSDVPKPS
jgi:hypothetical protein